jgi:hypothetical protein
MELSAALTANNATLDDNGLLHIQGGGWEVFQVPGFPATVGGFVAGGVEFGADEIGSYPVLRLTVVPEGQDAGSSGSMTLSAHRHRAAFFIPFTLATPEPNMVNARLFDEHDTQLGELSFPVRAVETPPAPESEA